MFGGFYKLSLNFCCCLKLFVTYETCLGNSYFQHDYLAMDMLLSARLFCDLCSNFYKSVAVWLGWSEHRICIIWPFYLKYMRKLCLVYCDTLKCTRLLILALALLISLCFERACCLTHSANLATLITSFSVRAANAIWEKFTIWCLCLLSCGDALTQEAYKNGIQMGVFFWKT